MRVGDYVICVNNIDCQNILTIGKLYKITCSAAGVNIRLEGTYREHWGEPSFFSTRFKELPDTKFNRLLYPEMSYWRKK